MITVFIEHRTFRTSETFVSMYDYMLPLNAAVIVCDQSLRLGGKFGRRVQP